MKKAVAQISESVGISQQINYNLKGIENTLYFCKTVPLIL
jgi:hypothetical protein